MRTGGYRWVPSVLVPVVVLGLVLLNSPSADANVNLPARTAAQVVALAAGSPFLQFSGEVTKTANLGLPAISSLPNVSQASVDQLKKTLPKSMSQFIPKASVQGNLATVLGFLSGTQQANVYYNNPLMMRVQILDPMSERDFIVNGTDVWYYDALQQTVEHSSASPFAQLPVSSRFLGWLGSGFSSSPLGTLAPASVGSFFLSHLGATTTVRLGPNVSVAGRGAYQLMLTPTEKGTLVSSVAIAVDGQTGLPLRVVINAVGQSAPAFSVEFNSVTFGASDPSMFAFSPPVGATVNQVALPSLAVLTSRSLPSVVKGVAGAIGARGQKLAPAGWATVVEIPRSLSLGQNFASNPYFKTLTKPVTGGRVFVTPLFEVLFEKDGRVFAGAVSTQRLVQAAR